MKHIRIIIFLFVLIGCKNDIQKDDIISNQEKDIILKYIKDFPEGTQFSISIIKNNEVGFLGYKIADDTIIKIDNKDSVFEIGAITKVFTSAILANLVIEKTLNLDDPIIDATLPFKFNPTEGNAQNITFKALANHTSGLPIYPSNFDSIADKNPSNPFSEYDSLLLLSYLENGLSLSSSPGESYNYSDLGYGLLGYLMEIKTGKSYEMLLKEYVTQKYVMYHTTSERPEVLKYLVKGINENGDTLPNWDFNIYRGSGAILSSTHDLSKFIKANLTNDPALYLQRQLTFNDHYHNVSLGWHMQWNCGYTPFYWYFHDGGTLGYMSSIRMDTKAKSAIIVLSNITAYHPLSGNISRMTQELLGNLYRSGEINFDNYCEAPYIEKAIEKGWGTRINDSISKIDNSDIEIIGVWQQTLPNRINIRTFTPNNKTQSDFHGDAEIDIWGYYDLKGDTVIFKDMGGASCDYAGIYKYKIQNDTLRFQLIKDDECDGRVSGMKGNWTRIKNK